MRLKLGYIVVTVAMLFCLSLSLERRAYAYVDPGSGLLVCQSASAIFAGMLYYFRRRLGLLFQKASNRRTERSSNR